MIWAVCVAVVVCAGIGWLVEKANRGKFFDDPNPGE